MKKKIPNILIVVSGGVVQSVVGDAPYNFIIKDFDNIEAGDTFDVNPDTAFNVGSEISDKEMAEHLANDLSPDETRFGYNPSKRK